MKRLFTKMDRTQTVDKLWHLSSDLQTYRAGLLNFAEISRLWFSSKISVDTWIIEQMDFAETRGPSAVRAAPTPMHSEWAQRYFAYNSAAHGRLGQGIALFLWYRHWWQGKYCSI